LLGEWGAGERAARRALFELIGGRPARIVGDETARFDRYGCRLAEVTAADGASLQRVLLERGLALVRPSARASDDKIDRWLALEAKARAAKTGLWRDRAALFAKASTADQLIGRIGLVEGRVVRSSDNKRYVYLNFGRDWKTDFTVRLRQKLLKQADIEPTSFDGKNLRVRGFVQESRGPLIDISHLKQIEVMP
jgi:hypothetical protein